MQSNDSNLPPRSAYPWYLAGASLWMAGMSLQGFMFTWMLVGILNRPADEVGLARSLAELPPLLILFLGGWLGDRYNGRSFLAGMHALIALPPLVLAVVAGLELLDYAWVVAFGMIMASIQALSDPARESLLSRVRRLDTQRAVTVMIVCTSLVGMAGFYLGGQLDALGLPLLLALQALFFLAGLGAILALPSLPPAMANATGPPRIAEGFRAVWHAPLVRDLIALNFASSLFNAGAYIVVIPYIVKVLYQGDAAFFATVMMVFTAGSIGSSLALIGVMPLARPGRVFLLMQPTRAIILLVLILDPPEWLFLAAIFAWGVNMGVTSTMVRTTVQELAEPRFRSQVLSILLLSFIVSSPISSALLGLLVEHTSPLTGLMPGIAVSLVICVVGLLRRDIWDYRSELPHSAKLPPWDGRGDATATEPALDPAATGPRPDR